MDRIVMNHFTEGRHHLSTAQLANHYRINMLNAGFRVAVVVRLTNTRRLASNFLRYHPSAKILPRVLLWSTYMDLHLDLPEVFLDRSFKVERHARQSIKSTLGTRWRNGKVNTWHHKVLGLDFNAVWIDLDAVLTSGGGGRRPVDIHRLVCHLWHKPTTSRSDNEVDETDSLDGTYRSLCLLGRYCYVSRISACRGARWERVEFRGSHRERQLGVTCVAHQPP